MSINNVKLHIYETCHRTITHHDNSEQISKSLMQLNTFSLSVVWWETDLRSHNNTTRTSSDVTHQRPHRSLLRQLHIWFHLTFPARCLMVSLAFKMTPNTPQFRHLKEKHFLSFLPLCEILYGEGATMFWHAKAKNWRLSFVWSVMTVWLVLASHLLYVSSSVLTRNSLFRLSKYQFFQGPKR